MKLDIVSSERLKLPFCFAEALFSLLSLLILHDAVEQKNSHVFRSHHVSIFSFQSRETSKSSTKCFLSQQQTSSGAWPTFPNSSIKAKSANSLRENISAKVSSVFRGSPLSGILLSLIILVSAFFWCSRHDFYILSKFSSWFWWKYWSALFNSYLPQHWGVTHSWLPACTFPQETVILSTLWHTYYTE